MRNFEIKQELSTLNDKLVLVEQEHAAKIAEMQKQIDAQSFENSGLRKDLQEERAKCDLLDLAKRQLKQTYDEDIASWQGMHRKLQDDLQLLH